MTRHMMARCGRAAGRASEAGLVAAAAAPVAAALLLCVILAWLPGSSAQDDDTAIMLHLRHMFWKADLAWPAHLSGWRPGDPAHPCSWWGVYCSDNHKSRRINRIELSGSVQPRQVSHAPSIFVSCPLAPEFAALRWLQQLGLAGLEQLPRPSIPPQWLARDAFPSLQRLSLAGELATPLPDIPPGALPRLETLHLQFSTLQSSLPAGWGASPAVLPTLQYLTVEVKVQGGLPAAWSAGFRQLRGLHILNLPPNSTALVSSTRDVSAKAAIVAAHRAASMARGAPDSGIASLPTGTATAFGVPPEWEAGGFPQLETLSLINLGMTGPLPLSGASSGFPKLQDLAVSYNKLTGNLPAELFEHRPMLAMLSADGNAFTGQLPAAWARSRHLTRLTLSNNSISGPAFPAAWLQPGAFPALRHLDLSGNPSLTGTLPSALPWPMVQWIMLAGSRVSGSVPSSWCAARFAAKVRIIDTDGTAVNPVLPPCAGKAFPVLDTRAWHVSHSAATSTGLPGPLPGLTACLAALLAAGAVGRVLWRRKLRQGQHSLRQGQHRGAAAAGAGGLPRSLNRGTRIGRTNALLHAALGTRGSMQLVPVEALPEAVTHQLGSLRRDGYPPARGNDSAELELVVAGGGAAVAERAERAGQQFARRQPASRSWGLHSQGLQLPPGELTFATDDRGEFVRLGEGAHATVYLAHLPGLDVAAKVFELRQGMDSSVVWSEVELLRRCAHERIVPLYGVAVQGQVLTLALKLMPGGTLMKALEQPSTREKLRWRAGGRQVALDVAEGLAYLHTELALLHGDLKPSNVLLSSDLRASISDLGVSGVVGSQGRTVAGFCCTHAAPEQLLGERCTLAADVYSFGLLLLELATGEVINRRGQWRLPHAPAECSQATLSLIEDCLSANPALRPSAAQVLQRLRAHAS